MVPLMQHSIICAALLWWRGSWATRRNCLLTAQSTFPTLACGRVNVETTRLWLQTVKISFTGIDGLTLKDMVRSSVKWETLGVKTVLLHIKTNKFRWFGYTVRCPLDASVRSFTSQLGWNLGKDSKHTGETIFYSWVQTTLELSNYIITMDYIYSIMVNKL